MLLTPDEYVAAIRSDGEALAVAAAADLSAPVPSCPGWNVAELVQHVGEVHRQKAAWVRRGGTERPEDLEPVTHPPTGASLLDWYRDGVDELLSELAAHDPSDTAYSWAGDHRVAFWQRRMAQETLVHRWDAEAAVGHVSPIDPALASDGVDELLAVFVPGTETPYNGPKGCIAFSTTDTKDRWTLTLDGRVVALIAGSRPSDALVTAPAADLLLTLWRRQPLDAINVNGDDSLVAAFRAWIDED